MKAAMEEVRETICRSCGSAAPTEAYFCPNCGKPLKEKPQETGMVQQLIAYSVSLLLPPFGLWYTWKYWRQSDEKSKKIAIVSAVFTIISVAVTIWATEALFSSLTQSVSGLGF